MAIVIEISVVTEMAPGRVRTRKPVCAAHACAPGAADSETTNVPTAGEPVSATAKTARVPTSPTMAKRERVNRSAGERAGCNQNDHDLTEHRRYSFGRTASIPLTRSSPSFASIAEVRSMTTQERWE
jgi:hypothetical protein